MSDTLSNPPADALGVPDDVAAMFDLSQKKKKKKSKKVEVVESGDQSNDADQNATANQTASSDGLSDIDPPQYSYSQLLNRVVDYLHLNNPDLIEKRRYTMKPPQLMRGNKNQTEPIDHGVNQIRNQRTFTNSYSFLMICSWYKEDSLGKLPGNLEYYEEKSRASLSVYDG